MISQLTRDNHYYQTKKLHYSANFTRTKENNLTSANCTSTQADSLRRDSMLEYIPAFACFGYSSDRLLHSSHSITAMTGAEHWFIKSSGDYDKLYSMLGKNKQPFLKQLFQKLNNLRKTSLEYNSFEKINKIMTLSANRSFLRRPMARSRRIIEQESMIDKKNLIPEYSGMTYKNKSAYPGNSSENMDVHGKKTENIYFHTQQKIEKEIQDIRKIIKNNKNETADKYAAANSAKSIDAKHLDINRISDQVYQNIERRIRMERERRGL
jgi:hypothetical protein